jgi:hypothetical protein
MSRTNLFALPLVGALVVFVTGTALANPWRPLAPACAPARFNPPPCAALPARPSVSPGELPQLEPAPNRQTLTIYNGAHGENHNFIERNGSLRSTGEFNDYDVFFRDSPSVPWRYYGTYYSARSADDAAGILKANGNLAFVRQHCA